MRGNWSLRTQLLAGILAPVALFIVVNSVGLYRQSLAAATTAYDRTLLASAKTIGEQLDVDGYDDAALLRSTVPYSALERYLTSSGFACTLAGMGLTPSYLGPHDFAAQIARDTAIWRTIITTANVRAE